MKPLNQILNNQQSQSDLTAGDCKSIRDMPMFMTPDEAFELGFTLLEPVLESKTCEFCDGELKPLGRRHFDRWKIASWMFWQKCQCPEAIAERERLEVEEKARVEDEKEAERRVWHQKQVEKLFEQSKIGERFRQRTFEKYEVNSYNKKACETAKKYVEDFEQLKKDGVGLIVNGGYGTGKTHLAAAIANELLNKAIPVIFGSTITLLGKLKESYQGEIRQSENDIIDLYSTVDLLIIDDIGKGQITDWVLEKLYLIINNRYENNLPLVITTNYTIDELKKRLSTKESIDTGEAIASRLWEMCRGIYCDWEDYRKR